MHKAQELPREEFKREVDRHLTGKETEPWEILYFKAYKSQLPVIERALETAALMLGTDKSRGYCLEMICADFLAGANLEGGDRWCTASRPGSPLQTPAFPQQQQFLAGLTRSFMTVPRSKRPRLRLDPESYRMLCQSVLERDHWRCQSCGSTVGLEVHHMSPRGQLGDDTEENLITLCWSCHRTLHSS